MRFVRMSVRLSLRLSSVLITGAFQGCGCYRTLIGSPVLDVEPTDQCGRVHRCKKRCLRFFHFGHVFTFLTFFLFSKRFFIFKKNVGKQINKKHFQNNGKEIDL